MMTLNTGREYIPCVCSGCENEAICKYTDDVVKAEESFNELKKSIKDYPECLSVKLSFYFFLKFLFRCVPKTVKMIHSLPFDFIVGCKVSFGNILGTLTRKLLHHISLRVILSSRNYRLTNCIFILPHKHYFVNSLILKF